MSRSPPWGAWIETTSPVSRICRAVVAPPRGERGLKPNPRRERLQQNRRSPSWGAWIETPAAKSARLRQMSRSPSWGAWIETMFLCLRAIKIPVAPPRGERGLKQTPTTSGEFLPSRSPSWGAWIETSSACARSIFCFVAPPRGERGLKQLAGQVGKAARCRSPSWGAWIETPCRSRNRSAPRWSLPLVGSVD